ncbi:hypothetical protein C0989_001118 [Termitomyces sp. Mn162]|nr:hypothetical protein C0989_001118 [Termitomyces sp. Mn162]
MVRIHTLNISPALINSSCAWASDLEQLTELYNSPFTGAVTTRTATLDGFQEGPTHTVASSFLSILHNLILRQVAFANSDSNVTSINSYGYSPHPLSLYLAWVKVLLRSEDGPRKPFIISITSSDPGQLRRMMQDIQHLRMEHVDTPAQSFIAIELNTSCPNIPNAPPTGYAFPSLLPLLTVLREEYAKDPTLTIGLKLPPFVYRDQFNAVIDAIKGLCLLDDESDTVPACPIAFFTCTNTLGNSLLFAEQSTRLVHPMEGKEASPFAIPTGLGGLAGDALHALALGNVYTFSKILREAGHSSLGRISVIGVGGVTSKAAAERMREAGATVVGCATLLGKEGIRAFEIIGGEVA